MPPNIARIVFAIGVAGLFLLDRDKEARTSRALWLPVFWLLINASRPVSMWLTSESVTQMQNPDQYLEGNPLDRFVYSALLLSGLVVLIMRMTRLSKLLQRNLPIVLFFVYGALSVLWSDYTEVSFKRWIKALGDLVMILIVLTDFDPYAALKRLVSRVGFILIPASVLLIKYFPALGRTYNIWTWEPQYVGVADHKNTLGMICMVFGLGFVWRFMMAYRDRQDERRTKRLVTYGVLLAMVVWLLLTANSTTSLACFVLGAALLLVTTIRRVTRTPALVTLVVASLLFCVVFALLLDSGGGLVGALGKDPTLTGRTDIWKLVLSMNNNPVLGTGFESFWLGERAQRIWSMYYFHPTQAHNGYIEVYLELGWLGIFLLVAIIVAGYRNALSTFAANQDAGRIRIAYIAIGLVYNVTEAGFRMTAPTWFFFLLSAVVAPAVAVEAAPTSLAVDSSGEIKKWRSEHDSVSASRRRIEAV